MTRDEKIEAIARALAFENFDGQAVGAVDTVAKKHCWDTYPADSMRYVNENDNWKKWIPKATTLLNTLEQ